MAASSVTGLHKNGAGGVDGSNKGSERMTLGTTHLIGPHVHAAGAVDLVGGAATVTFPQPLSGSEAGYVVMLTTDSAVASVSAKTDDGDGNFASFDIAGTGTDNVMYVVINM